MDTIIFLTLSGCWLSLRLVKNRLAFFLLALGLSLSLGLFVYHATDALPYSF